MSRDRAYGPAAAWPGARDLLFADLAEDFAAAVARLLAGPDIAGNLRRNVRRLVEDEYDWRAIAHRLDALIASKGCDIRHH